MLPKNYLQIRGAPKAAGLKAMDIYNKQPHSQQSHSFCGPLGTRHRCHLSRVASFVHCIATTMGLHVASRVGELIVRHSWGQRPVSRGSRSGLRRRAWLWVAGVEGRLLRTPLEQRLSHLRVTVVILVCSSGFSLKQPKILVSCIIMPLRHYPNY